MSSLRRHEGYLLIDHSNSPGVPNGGDAAHVGAGQKFESATVTCSHCHYVVVLNPDRSRARHYCSKCDHYVCDKLTCVVDCQPMNRTLDIMHAQALRLDNIVEI